MGVAWGSERAVLLPQQIRYIFKCLKWEIIQTQTGWIGGIKTLNCSFPEKELSIYGDYFYYREHKNGIKLIDYLVQYDLISLLQKSWL